MSATAREKVERLMTGALDGELSPEEQKEFNRLLAADKSLQEEFSKYKKLKQVTREMRLASPPAEMWDHYWLGVYNRVERGIGWLIFSIGMVLLLTYSGFKLAEAVINDPGLALVVQVGLVLAIAGLAVLFVSVAREKYFTRKHDPYKEILR